MKSFAIGTCVTAFTVEGEPVSWQRVKKDPRRGHVFVPARVRRAEKSIGLAYQAAGGRLLEGPVLVSCAFYLGGRASEAHLDARDMDNLLKTVLDGLQRVAYRNDRRVVGGSTMKAMFPTRPRTEVIVTHVAPTEAAPRRRERRAAVSSRR